ncbi:MAG: hydroxymethylglutaryl-CoA reductase, degradative [Pseudomonadota bacterium]
MPKFRHMTPSERHKSLGAGAPLGFGAGLPEPVADGMIENVIGTFELPVGVVPKFPVNGRDYAVPMAVEEPSVVAAAAHMAKIARHHGGFTAQADAPLMRAQIQVLGVADPWTARQRILAEEAALMAEADVCDPTLVSLGGGCRRVEVQVFPDTPVGAMVVTHLVVDVRDAMGANTVNTMAETLAPRIAALAEGRSRLRILSNLADLRLVRAQVALPAGALAEEAVQGMVEAAALALVDPYRAATHNKGIMNGIDPVVVATGNDWRAIEAGAHAFAARGGRYRSLTDWEIAACGGIRGSIELPLALGLVGGATKTHPGAHAALELMGVRSAAELAQVVAAVGLAQNMAALRALAMEGIQEGHMALHARNIAILAGARGTEVERVAKTLAAEGRVTVDRAKAVLDGYGKD